MATTIQGPDALEQTGDILQAEGSTHVLLLRGNRSYETSGAQARLTPQLKGVRVTEVSGFRQNPRIEDVEQVRQLLRHESIDLVLAVGGGTVMDIAKAAALLRDEDAPLEDFVRGTRKPAGRVLKQVTIPTTAGTGAEITPFAVVYIDKTKFSLGHPSMESDYVLLAPELTATLSPKITAETGCDALSQAIEGFWSVNATEESRQYSREAIEWIWPALPRAVNAPDEKSRHAMLWGAYLAGRSISIARTTAAHAFSYPMTAHHNIPHGHAVMLTLPSFFPLLDQLAQFPLQEGLKRHQVQQTFDALLALLQVSSGAQAKAALSSMMEQIHLPQRLSQLGVAKGDLQRLIDNSFNPQRIKNFPIQVSRALSTQIFHDIF